MAFVDDLGLIVALILSAAAVFTYTSVRAFLTIVRNDPKSLRSVLKASAIPVAMLGTLGMILAVFIETTWPFPADIGLGSYDIFFGDIVAFFSMVMLVYAVVAYFGLRLEYAGLFALIGGSITGWYGLWGYRTLVNPGTIGLTKDPLETFLLYLAFGAAGVFAFPASLAVDWFLDHPGPTFTPFSFALRPVTAAPAEPSPTGQSFHLPRSFYLLTIWFPIFSFLAFLAAWFYMGAILPGHLAAAP